MRKYWKFAVLMAIVVGSLAWLATAGISGSQVYYKTITEVSNLTGPEKLHRMRVMGWVEPNSIVRSNGIVHFTLYQDDQKLKVDYESRDPLPDTFKDGSQAMADGRMGPDGVFHSSEIQAKCASKYSPKPGEAPESIQKQLKTKPVYASQL